MMKTLISIAGINILLLTLAYSGNCETGRGALMHHHLQKDSVYYILVERIASAMERKIKRERQFFDVITSNAADVEKQSLRDSGIVKQKKGIKDTYIPYSGKPGLFQAGIADEMAIESLINLPYGKLDSIRILMDKTPQARAIYGNRMDVGILTLFSKARSRKPSANNLPIQGQPIELVKLSQMARSRADSTLYIFIQDIFAAVDEAGLNGDDSFIGFAGNERPVLVNGKEIGDVRELLEYSIFDIAAVTLQFNEKGTHSQRDAHPVTMCLTTYKNIN